MRTRMTLNVATLLAVGALIGWLAIPTAAQEKKSDSPFTPAQLAERTLHRRAVEAAIWGMPIVSVDWMRNGFFQNGAKYGDICYFSKPADWRFQITTPNASTNYVYFNYNVKDGPWMLELPAAVGAGLFGTFSDAWQVAVVEVGPTGDDAGEGGKYLIIPLDFKPRVTCPCAPPRTTATRSSAPSPPRDPLPHFPALLRSNAHFWC
jgi:hypothetical protein